MSGLDAPTPARDVADTRLLDATIGLARRNFVNLTRLPSAFLPALIMPIVQSIAFSGTFFAIIQLPGFPTDRSINWFLPLAVLMGCGFAGVGLGFSAIRDLEGGFHDRLRLTPAPRLSLVVGPMASAMIRAVIATTTVVIVGTVFGARLVHGPLGLLPLYLAGIGISVIGAGWALGLAFRFRDMRAAAIMQLTLFLALFLTEAQTPSFVIEGWLDGVVRVNPFNNILRLARLGWLDPDMTWSDTWGGLVAISALGAFTTAFARRGLATLSDQ
ncbi:MAG: ABC transporter permease [Actinomycetota bacterium]